MFKLIIYKKCIICLIESLRKKLYKVWLNSIYSLSRLPYWYSNNILLQFGCATYLVSVSFRSEGCPWQDETCRRSTTSNKIIGPTLYYFLVGSGQVVHRKGRSLLISSFYESNRKKGGFKKRDDQTTKIKMLVI